MFVVIPPERALVGLVWVLHYILSLVHSNINIFCNFIRYDFLNFSNYYVFHGSVTLFFANNSLTQCWITMKFLHNFFLPMEYFLNNIPSLLIILQRSLLL